MLLLRSLSHVSHLHQPREAARTCPLSTLLSACAFWLKRSAFSSEAGAAIVVGMNPLCTEDLEAESSFSDDSTPTGDSVGPPPWNGCGCAGPSVSVKAKASRASKTYSWKSGFDGEAEIKSFQYDTAFFLPYFPIFLWKFSRDCL